MATFTYKLITKEKRMQTGRTEAPSDKKAREGLEKNGAKVFYLLREKKPGFLDKVFSFSFGFSPMERIHFFRNMAAMTESGLLLTQSFRVFEEQTQKYNHKKIFAKMRSDMENGKKLSHAMSNFPRYFSDFTVETINVGEVTGTLTATLDRISVDLEKNHELRRKVVGAITYPLVVMAVMMVVLLVMVLYVLPQITDLFAELNAELPVLTRIILLGSSFVLRHIYLIGAIVAGAVIAFILLMRRARFRYGTHYLILKTPIFGNLIREYNLAQFFRALESLIASGVSLIDSVEIAKKTLNNDVYRKALEETKSVLSHGVPLSEALKPYPHIFPIQTQRIVEVGEQAGRYEKTFARIHTYFERSINHQTQMLTTLLEPILMIVIGVVVGALALSIFLPIYQVSTLF
ncbi:MAG: type II secretion system F family protein [bacterium]|nr:type II secretion system F family protein [bacterium]